MLSGSHANRMSWGGRRGYYRQPDPANYWLRARIYRDLAGRFLSADPVRQANPYSWPGNSPVMVTDPSGLQGCAHGPGGSCPQHAPSAQGWQPAAGGGGEGGHPHRRPCTPKSGCERRLTNDDWYIMCRCKEPDKRNWRCRCPHPKGWPRPPQEGMVQLVHVETCKSCSERNDPCKCHFQLWRVPILPPRRKWPFREETVTGQCKPCGGGGGGGDDGDGDGHEPSKCGPEIDHPLRVTVRKIRDKFASAPWWQKAEACLALITWPAAVNAWDIKDLHGARPSVDGCPSSGRCFMTTQVYGRCFPAGAVNYIMAGITFDLCGYSEDMLEAYLYIALAKHVNDPVFVVAAWKWAKAGYAGWPSAETPPEWDYRCPRCALRATESEFGVHWTGLGDF